MLIEFIKGVVQALAIVVIVTLFAIGIGMLLVRGVGL